MKFFTAVFIFSLFLLQSVAFANPPLWNKITNVHKASSTKSPISQQLFHADTREITRILSRAGMEGRAHTSGIIELPVVSGNVEKFTLLESPIIAPELAAKYPAIKTYKIVGIDNPHNSGRLSITRQGFHAMITGPSGTFYIDPQSKDRYSAYHKNKQQPGQSFNCGVKGHTHDNPLGSTASRPAYRTAGSLRVYRLAVAATSEYQNAVGGSAQNAHDEIIVAINRVNQIYQRDLGIKLELVDNNDALLEAEANLPAAYSNFNELAMLDENQRNIDSVIGSANYDIGHVFGTGGGGIAEVGSVCTSLKAGGATGLFDPTGDAFYIDYVAHEMGHQFSAEHSFNGTTLNCQDLNRWQPSAFEPGSGSTIMSYAGICGSENIANNADAVFHAGSIDQVDNFTTSGSGANCGGVFSVNNPSEPEADAGSDFLVPVSTPFKLTATGSDADGDTLSFSWDQMDAGTSTNSSTFGEDLGDNALMRSRLPQATPTRYFPQLDSVVSSETDKAEVLPTTDRDINFRLTVRDGHSGLAQDDVTISSTTAAGPFRITSNFSSSLTGNTQQTLRWDVAGTDSNSINCSLVDIDLLMMNSSKTTYCVELLETGVANDGSALVTLPDLSIPRAHFRVSCSDNVFYAVSQGDLIINGGSPANISCKTVVPQTEQNEDVIFPDPPTDDSSSGGALGFVWLFSLFSLMIMRRVVVTSEE